MQRYDGRMNPKKPRAACRAGCGRECKTPNGKYCSNRCQHTVQRQERVQRFLEGRYIASAYTFGTSFIRMYLMSVYEERCAQCGWSERNPVTDRVPLEIEHKDGDWKNVRPENLTLLCPNCHALGEHYGGRNRGRGRAGRRYWRKGQRAPQHLRRYDPASGATGSQEAEPDKHKVRRPKYRG